MSNPKNKISFDKKNLDNKQKIQQVYGIEFRYNDQSLGIKNFSLSCFYQLLRSAFRIFNDPYIDVYDYCNQVDQQEVDLLIQIDHLTSQATTINDHLCFYNIESVITHSQSIKTCLDIFGSAKHFYQNHITDMAQLADWAIQFVKLFTPSSINPESQILNSIGFISRRQNREEILNRIYQTLNLVTDKIYSASQRILVVPDLSIDLNQIQINIVVKKVQYNPVSSYDISDISSKRWNYIVDLITTELNVDRDLISLLASNSFNHFYSLKNITRRELDDVETQLIGSLSETDFHINRYYLACTTDEAELILKLLIPGEFECLDDICQFLRTCIQ